MKITDKTLGITLVAYLVWVCYYRLFGNSESEIYSMLYFSIESIVWIVILLRAYYTQYSPIMCKIAKNVIAITLGFKVFQGIFISVSYTDFGKKYLINNDNVIWSGIGVILIVSLLITLVLKILKR